MSSARARAHTTTGFIQPLNIFALLNYFSDVRTFFSLSSFFVETATLWPPGVATTGHVGEGDAVVVIVSGTNWVWQLNFYILHTT